MRKLILALFVCAVTGYGQAPSIRSGSTVYIEPMGGYETYLAAALVKKRVPLVLAVDRDKADYVIRNNISHVATAQPAIVVNNSNINNNDVSHSTVTNKNSNGGGYGAALAALGSTSASIAVVDPQSSRILFAYAADKTGAKQFQRTAEDCAKHLKKFIEESEKPKK